MTLITDNATFRRFIPNSFANTIDGSASLFDKAWPFLEAAEIWFTSRFLAPDILTALTSGDTLFLARRAVSLKAWLSALPSIDVLITHNGVGVAETPSLKPASKAKIDRLLQSLEAELDSVLEQLTAIIGKIPGFHTSEPARLFRRTLFRTFTDLRQLGISSRFLDRFLEIIPRIEDAQRHIARLWVSSPVMKRLLSQETFSGIEQDLVSEIKAAVADMIAQREPGKLRPWNSPVSSHLQEAAHIVISNPGTFPEFIGSSTEVLFKTESFRNDKKSSAHWL